MDRAFNLFDDDVDGDTPRGPRAAPVPRSPGRWRPPPHGGVPAASTTSAAAFAGGIASSLSLDLSQHSACAEEAAHGEHAPRPGGATLAGGTEVSDEAATPVSRARDTARRATALAERASRCASRVSRASSAATTGSGPGTPRSVSVDSTSAGSRSSLGRSSLVSDNV